MRVLHLISSGGLYGAEAVILSLSRVLDSSGEHRSLLGIFANSAQPNEQLLAAAQRAGVEVHAIPCRGQLDRHVPGSLRQLAKVTQANIVHAHGYKADVYAAVAFRAAQHPALVSTCHTWYDNDFAVRLYGALDRSVLRRFQAVVAVSEEVRARLVASGVRPGRIAVIRNGVDVRPFAAAGAARWLRGCAGAEPHIGLVGRLAPEKGVDLFLQAAAEVRRTWPGARFSVVGDGPERPALEALRAKLGLADSVALLGHCDDMPGFYGSLDLLVSASRQEGLPMALLEGMASACPPLATSVGAVPTAVRDGDTGLLVPPEDSSALAQATLRLLADDDLRERLGRTAQKCVEQEFSAEHMTAAYLELYRVALARDNAPQSAAVS